MSEGATPVGRQTLRRCIQSVQDLLTSEVRWRALTLEFLLVALLFAINGLNVVNSYVARDFMTAVAGRDMPGFARQALLYLAVFAASTAVDERSYSPMMGAISFEHVTQTSGQSARTCSRQACSCTGLR